MKKIGVISDTHGLLREEAQRALQGVDHIIHAGDIGTEAVMENLRKIAPVTAVRGNCDRGSWAAAYPETREVKMEGVSIFILHDLKMLDRKPREEGYQIVISGHSHKPKEEMKEGVLYFNPGSAGPRRFRLPISLGFLEIQETDSKVKVMDIL